MESLNLNDEHFFVYGRKTINYIIIYCDRRTMEIAVHPDCSVIIKAPKDSAILLIKKKLQKRARWIIRQLNYFKQFSPKTPSRCYVNGETHLYLGKQYRLQLTEDSKDFVKLSRGFFHITTRFPPTPETAQELLNAWYLEKANTQFKDSLDRCWPKFKNFDVIKPSLSIKRMQKRWGSLSKKGTLTLNTDLVRAPKECIDYVVTHELCHLKYHDHGSEFYNLLDSVIPGWEKIKYKLEISLC